MYKFVEGFESYGEFVSFLEHSLAKLFAGECIERVGTEEVNVGALLNGANRQAVSRLIERSYRKEHGIFFTHEALADRVASRLSNQLRDGASVLDPSCGSGDLLLACAKYLPERNSLVRTLQYWSARLHGIDINDQFVRSARSRLSLYALSRFGGKTLKNRSTAEPFRKVKTQNFFDSLNDIQNVDCIIANPPFGHVEVTDMVEWGAGRSQLAAVFIDKLIVNAKSGQRVVAILPDVLRSGTRYSRWREYVKERTNSLYVEEGSKFDAEANVDYFLLDLVVKGSKKSSTKSGGFFSSPHNTTGKATSVSDYFDLSVGPVVPHRQNEGDSLVPYVDVKSVPLWKESIPINQCRYLCTLKKPPFVVIRRTSSPSDPERARASIIRGKAPVAVENHLIVLEPKDGKLQSCRNLLGVLKSPETTDKLNSRIRCRHLTKASIAELPYD